MGNTFGPPGTAYPLVDPRCIHEHRERFRRELFPELERANSYYSMAGRWPDIGWLLIDRGSLNNMNLYANNLQLTIQDYVNPALTISNISIVQARCVTKGITNDPNAIYLVQVTNNEGVLYNPWFQFPVNVQYNVRAPGYDGSFYSGSLNSGVPWTWDTMVGNLWAQTPLLGTYPHLPITPTGTPEGFTFIGIPLWEVINHIMDYLGLTISGEYPNFTITVAGSADTSPTGYTSLAANYVKYLEDSMEYQDAGNGRVPSTVVVYFHMRYQYYGTEETVRDDSLQWQTNSVYSVTLPAPSLFAQSSGTGYIWADFTVRIDQDGNPLAADVTTANAIAAERVVQFFNTIYRGTQGFLKHIYSGVLPFSTGSLVDGVRWFNTGKLGDLDDRFCGWRTEVLRGYIWPEATFPLTLKGLTGPTL